MKRAVHTGEQSATKQFIERHDNVTQGVMDKQSRSSADKYLRSQQTQRRMIQETRSQKSGPTAGKKEHSQQQAKRAYSTAGEEQCQQQARTRTSSCVTKVART